MQDAPDSVVRLYSRRLIEVLEAAGFTPLIRHCSGEATFVRNDTLNRVITEYVDASDRERHRAHARRDVAEIKQRYRARSEQNVA
jgi:hypothetical protein